MSKELLPELAEVGWLGRDVEVFYDSNVVSNPNVRAAEQSLCSEVSALGATVSCGRLPEPYDLDDFLLKHKLKGFEALPRIPFGVKEQLSLIRKTKGLSARARNEQISALTISDMKAQGTFYKTVTELFYFSHGDAALMPLYDVRFRTYMNELYGLNGSEQEWKFVLEDLVSKALRHGEETAIHKFAHYDATNSRLYLAHGDNHLIRIGPKGFEIVPNGTDGVLVRPDRQREKIPIATRPSKKALSRILAMPNFRGGEVLTPQEEKKLYLIWFWSLYFPELQPTRPILLLVGPKGSSKTSSARAVLQVLFGPNVDVTKADGEREDALATALTNKYIVALDNVDGHIAWLANLIATAATGGTIARRILYTTNDLIEYPIDCFVIATSREPKSFKRDDVVDRLLVLSCSRRGEFISESALLAQTKTDRPAIWKSILDTLSKIIVALKRSKSQPVAHRLADFANFAYRIGPVLGIPRPDVQKLFVALERERTEFTLQHSDVLQALVYWVEDRKVSGSVTLTSGELYRQAAIAWPGLFPFHKPSTFGRALMNEKKELKRYFSITDRRVHGNRKELTITPKITLRSVRGREKNRKF